MAIWKEKKREGVERLQERYLRWLLEVKIHTLGYLIREELQREKLKGRTGMRTWEYGSIGKLGKENWEKGKKEYWRGDVGRKLKREQGEKK